MSAIKKFSLVDRTAAEREAFCRKDVVDGCFCYGATLVELQQIAREHNLTCDQLLEATGVGGDCEACIPYIRRSLETGETSIKITMEEQKGMWAPDPTQGLRDCPVGRGV